MVTWPRTPILGTAMHFSQASDANGLAETGEIVSQGKRLKDLHQLNVPSNCCCASVEPVGGLGRKFIRVRSLDRCTSLSRDNAWGS